MNRTRLKTRARFEKKKLWKMESYFGNKEMCVYHFWENLKKKITLKSLMRNESMWRVLHKSVAQL